MRWARFPGVGCTALVAVAVVSVGVLGWAGAAGATNDPYFPEQWALEQINAPPAWTLSTGAGVRIGIIDTGIDLQHEDLAAKVVASTSCIGAGEFPGGCGGSAQDDQGHGTHVSGIAAAITSNGKGIAGVAPDAQLVVVKALGANGSGALNDVNVAIKWAVDHGARIINLSLESDGTVASTPGQSLKDGVEYAWSKGAIPVLAAGNSTPSLFGQTGYEGIDAVVVGATGRNGGLAWYSSPLATAKWGLVAPGGDGRDSEGRASCAGGLAADCVVSTGWFPAHANQYADDEGTSMAAPHVSGVLALLLAQGLSPTAAVQRLLATADPDVCGDGCHGLVDAAAAVGARVVAPPTTNVTRPPPTAAPPVTRPVAPPAIAGGSTSPVKAVPPTTSAANAPHPTLPARPQRAQGLSAPAPLGRKDHGLGALPITVSALALAGVAVEGLLVLRSVRAFGGQ